MKKFFLGMALMVSMPAVSQAKTAIEGYQFDCDISLFKDGSTYSAAFYGDANTGDGTFLIIREFELAGKKLNFTFHEGNDQIHLFEAQLWQPGGTPYFDAAGVLEKSGQVLLLVANVTEVGHISVRCERR